MKKLFSLAIAIVYLWIGNLTAQNQNLVTVGGNSAQRDPSVPF